MKKTFIFTLGLLFSLFLNGQTKTNISDTVVYSTYYELSDSVLYGRFLCDSISINPNEIPKEQYMGFKEGKMQLQDFYELIFCYNDPDCYCYLITKNNIMLPEINPSMKSTLYEVFFDFAEKENMPADKFSFVLKLIGNLK
jgi:hypothetical protein